MTRSELLGSTSLTVAHVTAPGPLTLTMSKAAWDAIRRPRWDRARTYSGSAHDMLRQVRASEERLAEEREILIASAARRAGETFAMAGMRLEVQIDDGHWIEVANPSPSR